MEYHVRPIAKEDNAAVAEVIRTVMTEYGCVGEGFSITDPEVDDMHGYYQAEGHHYFVVEEVTAFAKTIVLVGGFAPLIGGDATTCELRKMYGYGSIRGKGIGRKLIEHILEAARAEGFKQMYLETASSMTEAARLYKRFGFEYIEGALGNTGHGGCDHFMLRQL